MSESNEENTSIVIGRQDKRYERTVVGTFNIPEEFIGKYLRMDSKTGEVVHLKSIGLDPKVKAANIVARNKISAEKKAKVKVAKDKLRAVKDVLVGKVRDLKKELRKAENSGNVALSNNYKELTSELADIELKTFKDYL